MIDYTSQSFRFVWLFCCIHLGTPCKLIVLFYLMYGIKSDLQTIQSVLMVCSQPQKSFFPSFSITFLRSQFLLYHFVSSGSSLFSTVHFTANTFKVLLCRLTYSVPTILLYPNRKWCTVSQFSPHNLHLLYSTNTLNFFHTLVSIICSSNANMDDVSLRSLLHFNQPGVFFTIYCLGITLKLLLCLTSFFVLQSGSFSVFSIFLSIQCNFLRQLSSSIITLPSSNETVTSTFLITFSASFFSDIYSFWLSFLHAALVHSFVAVAM